MQDKEGMKISVCINREVTEARGRANGTPATRRQNKRSEEMGSKINVLN